MIQAPSTAEIKEKLAGATEEELQHIIDSSQNLMQYYTNILALAFDEVTTRDPIRPVQLELF